MLKYLYDQQLSDSELRDRELSVPVTDAELDALCRRNAAQSTTDELIAEVYRLADAKQPFEVLSGKL